MNEDLENACNILIDWLVDHPKHLTRARDLDVLNHLKNEFDGTYDDVEED